MAGPPPAAVTEPAAAAPAPAESVPATATRVTPAATGNQDYMRAVLFARERTAAVKAEQDATVGAMVMGTVAVYALTSQLIENVPADLIISLLLGCAPMGFAAGFEEGPVGDTARTIGGAASAAAGKVADFVAPLAEKVKTSIAEEFSA